MRLSWALLLGSWLATSCSSSGATTCPFTHDPEPMFDDLPAGSCSSGQSCPEIVTRVMCPYGPEVGPSVIYACSCQQGAWQCVETGRSKGACNPAGPDAASNDGPTDGVVADGAADRAAPDALAPGACAGPSPYSCHFGGGPEGVCDHVGHAATCRDGAWVCTDEHFTPLVPASQCRCFVTASAVYPCHCENGAPICTTPDAAVDH